MARNPFPEPTLTLTKAEGRRFLLAHQHLWPPRRLEGKAGILEYIAHVGCIQYDPIDIVGRNADLVLQARVAGYRPELLEELLYTDRLLWDGWDKVSSIHLAADWPFFGRFRAHMRARWDNPTNPAAQVVPEVRQAIRERGPLSSNDLEHRSTVHWSWGTPARLGRAALETLHAMGELGIHHRFGTRRYFDLIERLLPANVLALPEPNPTDEEYHDWHVRRRVGGLGLALSTGSAEYWLNIHALKGDARKVALTRLALRGDLVAVSLEGVPERTFFLRQTDLPILEAVRGEAAPAPQAALIGPLDNLTWDRELLRRVFDFDYIWEVYKPQEQRKYGYYVLPVLYGDRFVARLDPAFDKRSRTLVIANWWWEEDVRPDDAMEAALAACLTDFLFFLRADRFELGPGCAHEPAMRWTGEVSLDTRIP
jgi:uncharacterized protein